MPRSVPCAGVSRAHTCALEAGILMGEMGGRVISTPVKDAACLVSGKTDMKLNRVRGERITGGIAFLLK